MTIRQQTKQEQTHQAISNQAQPGELLAQCQTDDKQRPYSDRRSVKAKRQTFGISRQERDDRRAKR